MSKEEKKSAFQLLLEALKEANDKDSKAQKVNKNSGLSVSEIMDLINDDDSKLTSGVVRDAARGISSTLMHGKSVKELLNDPDHVAGILIGMAMVLESKAANIAKDTVVSSGDDTVKSLLQLSGNVTAMIVNPAEAISLIVTSITDWLKAEQKKAS